MELTISIVAHPREWKLKIWDHEYGSFENLHDAERAAAGLLRDATVYGLTGKIIPDKLC